MKELVALVSLILAVTVSALAQTCALQAKEVKPVLPTETQKLYERNLAAAFEEAAKKNHDADSTIWLGRRIAYLGNYRDAIRQYTAGIGRFPNDARLYRHRGHRFITLRCFDDAIADLEKAASLTMGKQDEIEPDGLPNSRNISTSTLQANIYYHLGLAYYLKGDFNKSAQKFMDSFNRATTADMKVAAAHWVYMSGRRYGLESGLTEDQRQNLDRFISTEIKDGLDIIENGDYYTLVKLYQGKESGEKLIKQFETMPDSTSRATLGYGLGNRWLYHNRQQEAIKFFKQVTAGTQLASFGYIAAEVDLKRLGLMP